MAIHQVDSTPIDENELKQNKQIHYTSHWKPELFISAESIQHFKCVKCNNIPKQSHECDKGHLFCEDCIRTLINSNQMCSVNQHKISLANKNVFASNIINDLKIKCIHSHSINDINASIEGDIYDTKQPEMLIDKYCNWIGYVKDMDTHLKQSCRIQKYIDYQIKFHKLEENNILLKQHLNILQTNLKQCKQQNKSLQQTVTNKTNEINSLHQTIQKLTSQITENKKLQVEFNNKANENDALKKYVNELELKLKQIENQNKILNIRSKYNENEDDLKCNMQQKYKCISIGKVCIQKDEIRTLESFEDIIYDIEQLILNENAILTVNGWNSEEREGGFLNIGVQTNIIMKKGSKISVSGLGYKGGQYKGFQGESYFCVGKISCDNNAGGGGGGGGSLSSGHGGGGSYGSKGNHGWNDMMGSKIGGGKSGEIYGNEKLDVLLYRGSGGGASGLNGDYCGGNGGGIIQIECNGIIIMEKDTIIEANGMSGDNNGGGGGSGGSIKIVAHAIKMDNSWWTKCGITAKGGVNVEKAAKGGDGRICCLIEDITEIQKENIIPTPFMG
eukprot:37790_1